MSNAMHDELLIRQMVERWAVWRDAGDWDRFATVWHPEGVMMATWFQGPFSEFIRVTQEGWAKGVSILHFLGGSAVEVVGDRAIAQTKMTISQRGMVEGENGPVLCDVVCTGRFYDFVTRHNGEWKFKAIGYGAGGELIPGGGPLTERHNTGFDKLDANQINAVLGSSQPSVESQPAGRSGVPFAARLERVEPGAL